MAFVPVNKVLGNLLRGWNLSGDVDAYKVFDRWEEIVGEKVALHAKPVRTANRILYVEVDDPMWRTQLKYMRDEIMNRINEVIKEGAVRDVRFFVRP